VEEGYTKNKKPVRYDFDEEVFGGGYSWKGYVHLDRIVGQVTQVVSVGKQGTYRMVVRYVNAEANVTGLVVRVRPVGGEAGDEQQALVYLRPAEEAAFETVTINQLSALTLELEEGEYEVSFENVGMAGVYLDYFVLLPSEYFETPVLERRVAQACEDYRNEEACVEYRYLGVEEYPHVVVVDSLVETSVVEVDLIKEFNHTYARPLMAKRVLANQVSRHKGLIKFLVDITRVGKYRRFDG